MQFLALLVFVAIAVINAKRNNERKAEQARRQASTVREAERQSAPAYQPTTRRQRPVQPLPVERPAPAPAKRPAPAVAPTPVTPLQGSLVFNSHEGDASLEGKSAYAAQPQHVVQPLTESKHGHTESSLTGVEACPPDTSSDAAQQKHDAAYDIRTSVRSSFVRLGAANIRQAVVFSEVLGKPKALRR